MKALNKKLKKFFRYFKMSNLLTEVATLGATITAKNIVILFVVIAFASFIGGYLLRLNYAFCAALILFFFLCMPSIIISRFKSDYERNRFNDVVNYMEHMIYAFHKSNKIREALVDVRDVTNGHIQEIVAEMLAYIDKHMEANVYQNAFEIIEDDYDCARMKLLHNYLIEVEENGGESARSLNMLLTDIRDWSERTLTYQANRKNVKGKVTLSIFFAMISCGLMINMIPAEYVNKIVVTSVYQVGTLVVLLGCILLYVITSNRVCISYFDNEQDKETTSNVLNQMKFLTEYNKKDHVKPRLIKLAMIMVVTGVAAYFKVYWASAICLVAGLLITFSDLLRKNTAVKSVVREVNKMFPAWIRNLVLYLQTDNVQVAIRKSYDTCPKVLKSEVEQFIRNLDDDPTSSKPYYNFLRDFHVPNLKMSVHYLYSIAQFGTQDMLAQLDYLIEQNSQLTITEERIRNEDSLAGFGALTLAPMLLAVIKLIIDLVLLLSIFMEYMSSYGNAGFF